MILALLAALFGAAQEAIVVHEGDQIYCNVDVHPGNNYMWEVVTQFNPVTNANISDFSFINGSNSFEAEIKWLQKGNYYLMVTETDASGCTNSKALGVSVLPKEQSIEFEITTSNRNACFDLSGNSFEQSVSILKSSGKPLEDKYFPLAVEFKVNDVIFSQPIELNNNVLQIRDRWFSINSEQNTEVVVEITKITGNDNTIIPISNGNNRSTSTIFAIPKIEFNISVQDTIPLYSYHTFEATYQPDYTYLWWYVDNTNDTTYFSSHSNITEESVSYTH